MQVLELFSKPLPKQPTRPEKSLKLLRGFGIENDIHSQWGSPRQILIVSQTTLQTFGLSLGDLGENILLDESIEEWQSGQVIRIGEQVLLRLMFHCEPCQYLESLQLGLKKKIQNRRGFLAMVIEGGTIHPSDRVCLSDHQFPPLSNIPKERFIQFVNCIPTGKVINTTDLLVGIGVQKSYHRAVATWIKNRGNSIPVHRIIKADSRLFTNLIQEQKQLLNNENVVITHDQVDYQRYGWDKNNFYPLLHQ
jgi:alkylated DNA nucleotide flippase Atl1